METHATAAPSVLHGFKSRVGGGSAAESPSAATAEAATLTAAKDLVVENEQIVVLSSTNGVATMGLATHPAQISQLSGHTFQNGLMNLALTGARREDEIYPLIPEEVHSIASSYSSVSSPEILSPNPRTPDLPQGEFGDTQCSLIRGAEDLNIGTSFNGDAPWIVLGKRESASHDNSGELNGRTSSHDGVFDVNGAISSSQFIFTQFGKGVPGSFTSGTLTSHTPTSNSTTTTKALPQTVQQAISVTPPAKRLKQPSLNVAHASKAGPYELKILSQPEEQHRARYLTEGSRGSVKDRSGGSYPTVQLIGYDKPATLQVFVGCDSGKVKPHGFYQACKVYGKSTNQFEEREIDGTQVIEIQMDPENDMKVCIDCVGILKLRNADVEARIGPVRSKKRSNRARLVFRVQIPDPDGGLVTLQTASQPILCTQPVGQPEICRMSLTSAPYSGGDDLYLIGKNFLKGSKVIFRETNAKDETVWEKEAQIDPEFFHQMHIICTVPSYDHERLATSRVVSVVVASAGRCSEGYHFTYTPGPQNRTTQTTTCAPWQTTYAVPEVMSVIKMETETVPVHQVNMETSTALPPDTLYPLIPPGQTTSINTSPGVQHSRNISALDEDSPTSTKPAGMLMDSDPMVSSTISMGVTPPNPPAPFPLVSESSNEMTPWPESTNQTPSKSVDVYVDESKTNDTWTSESSDSKMEVSHETYKSDDKWQNEQWNATKSTAPQWTSADTTPTPWTAAESSTTQWNPTKTESLPVEIPKQDVWNDSSTTYVGSNDASGFDHSWNSVIEVTNAASQWRSTSPTTELAKQTNTVTYSPAPCAPEMALAPKEFTANYAKEQVTPKFGEGEAVRPLLGENQATIVLRNKHGGQPVLMTADELVLPHGDGPNSGSSVLGAASGVPAGVAEYSTTEPNVFSIPAQTLSYSTTTASAASHFGQSTAQLASFNAVTAPVPQTSVPQTSVPVLITSQSATPQTYVILTKDRVPIVQVITTSQQLVQEAPVTEAGQGSFRAVQTGFGQASVVRFQSGTQTTAAVPVPMDEGSQGASNGSEGPDNPSVTGEVKDGLSGGTLPTISLEDVCHILRD